MATTKITSPDLFDLGSLDSALKLPSGTTAERPTSPSTGEWRYNTTTNLVEFWDGGAWRDLQSENIPPIPSEHFNTVVYTGNGSTQSITGVGFKPDFVWIKPTSFADNHALSDSSRGVDKSLASNTTAAEQSLGVTSFDADGFSLPNWGNVNQNGETFVAWCWKANGGTTSSNTDGTITSTVQANTKAAFSVVSYTGNAVSGATIGHGLGVEPDIVIVKNLNLSTQSWNTYVKNVTTTNAQFLTLNTADANGNTANPRFIPGNFSSSVFSVGNDNSTNGVSGVDTYIAYCFASVAGYSSIGTYTGNGSTNGPIINTGFEPAFLMTKQTNTSSNWVIVDNKRSTTNPRNKGLRPNTNDSESTVGDNMVVDFLTNGFQLKQTSGANDNGGTFLYIAFASDASAAPTLPDSFATALYAGNNTSQSIAGLGFSPSLVWIKNRGSAQSHSWTDSVRGNDLVLQSNETAAETTGQITLDSDGFTIGNNNALRNALGNTYVAWNWKGNTVPTINTDGDTQTVVSANQAAGFSIVSFNKTTNSSTASTFGHGLGVAPEMIILKRTDGVEDWYVYNTTLGNAARIQLNSSAAQTTGTNVWGQTDPTSTVFTVESFNAGNAIAYCFESTAGFSKIGTYTGNGSSTGPTITTGFQPSWIMIKRIQNAASWAIVDAARGGNQELYANLNDADNTFTAISFLSDGFQIVNTANGYNSNGETYIYMAFKQTPINTIPAGQMAYLVGAGGGGTGTVGSSFSAAGGGGGAGGLRTSYGATSGGGASAESNITLSAGTYTVTIGAGGGASTNGSASTVTGNATISTVGGGAGGNSTGSPLTYVGQVGGSGGGGGSLVSGTQNFGGGAGTSNEGFAGSLGEVVYWSAIGNNFAAGGGGGGAASAAVTTNQGSSSIRGTGGNGLRTTINNDSGAYFAAGGAGMSPGTIVNGAGHHSSSASSSTEPGQPNTSDGGPKWGGLAGFAGGSGVVIFRLKTSEYSGTTTGSPTVTTIGDETVLTYTGSGTYVHS
jgi:hypothetical protein